MWLALKNLSSAHLQIRFFKNVVMFQLITIVHRWERWTKVDFTFRTVHVHVTLDHCTWGSAMNIQHYSYKNTHSTELKCTCIHTTIDTQDLYHSSLKHQRHRWRCIQVVQLVYTPMLFTHAVKIALCICISHINSKGDNNIDKQGR